MPTGTLSRFPRVRLVSSHTRDRVKDTLPVKNTGKEHGHCPVSSSCHHRKAGQISSDPVSQRLQDCNRIVGTNDAPRGDAPKNQGRTGHHLAALPADLLCCLQILYHLLHRPHPRLTLKHQFTQLVPEGLHGCTL